MREYLLSRFRQMIPVVLGVVTVVFLVVLPP
jgi:ABC-type microcin C transport system permease subunit YejB